MSIKTAAFTFRFVGVLMLLTLLAGAVRGMSVYADTITVTNTTDGGAGSLRQAIADAASGDTIIFDSSLSGLTITLTSGELAINKDLTINGLAAAPGLAISGNNASRVFSITAGTTAAITYLTIGNGLAQGSSTLSGYAGDGAGGGVYNAGTLTLQQVTLRANAANGGASNDYGGAGLGGGVYNAGTLMLQQVTLAANAANGGAAETRGGNGSGGGVYNTGTLTLQQVTLASNVAEGGRGYDVQAGDGIGGGIHNAGTLTLQQVTLTANAARGGRGGFCFFPPSCPGGDGTGMGGGMYNASGSPTIINSIFWGSTPNQISPAGGLNVTYSVVQGGYPDPGGTTISNDPLLGPLGNYGGSTQTFPLLAGSSAIDTGNDAICPSPDQRGVTRPQGAHCDIGAYEVNPPHLYLTPADASPSVTQIFTVEIKADTGSATADTVDACLDFDPAFLQVVDASGIPVTTIEPNPATLPNVSYNTVNTTTGQIDFSASNYATPLSGTFTAAAIRFKATTIVSSTSVTLIRSGARWSDLLLAGESLAPDLSGTVAHVTLPTLLGRVALEKRGSAGDSRWITPLYRMNSSGVATGWVRLYQPGTSNLAGVYSATTTALGQFTVTLDAAPPGVYDVVVKGANTLSNKKFNVSLPSAGEGDLGTLRVGDNNGDDRVNGDDVSYLIPSFIKCAGDSAFRPDADTNNNGCVNGADVSALIPNFTKAGPIIVTGTSAISVEMVVTSPGAVRLSISPLSPAAHVGEILTLDLVAETGVNRVDTVDAYLNFDPAQLEVVTVSGAQADQIDLNPALAYEVTVNAADNAAGQIDFSASTLTSPPLSGTFTVATIRVRVKSAITAGAVRFAQAKGRHPDLYAAGWSLQPVLAAGSAHRLYLPALCQ